MVVVMAAEAGETEINGIVELVRGAGGDAFVSRGVSRTIVGLVGDIDQLDTLNLRGMPGVSDVVRITAPYGPRYAAPDGSSALRHGQAPRGEAIHP